jgi:hypothetical protein
VPRDSRDHRHQDSPISEYHVAWLACVCLLLWSDDLDVAKQLDVCCLLPVKRGFDWFRYTIHAFAPCCLVGPDKGGCWSDPRHGSIFVRNLGLTIAVAVATVTFENCYDRAARSLVKGGSVPGIVHTDGRQASGAWHIVQKLPGAQRNAYEGAYASGLRWTLAFMAGVLVAGLVASHFLRDGRLDSKAPVDSEKVLSLLRLS